MKNVNFWRSALKIEGRAGGLHKKAVRQVAEKGRAGCRKGQPSSPPFFVGQLNVQSAGPHLCAARQPTENSCFSFGNMTLQPARLPALRLVLSDVDPCNQKKTSH